MTEKNKIGLVLSGGGARGAYQVGALRGILESIESKNIKIPFPIIVGCSAGAINASYLAAYADQIPRAVQRMTRMWSNIHTGYVIDVSTYSVIAKALRVAYDLVRGRSFTQPRSKSLLDTAPLEHMLSKLIPFKRIQDQIDKKTLHGLAIKSINYSTGFNTTFYQGHDNIEPWARQNRKGIKQQISIDHLMASSAIPLLFPAKKIQGHHYGDGSIRNLTPLSPAIKLGADKMIVIGVRQEKKENLLPDKNEASFAKIISVILNTIFLDSIDLDYERLTRINETLSHLKKGAETALKPVDTFFLKPSQDLGALAQFDASKMPRIIRHLIEGLGSGNESSDLMSYLLFEPEYIKRLINLGYEDTMNRSEEILEFFS